MGARLLPKLPAWRKKGTDCMEETIQKILSGSHFAPLESVLKAEFGVALGLELKKAIECRLQALLKEHESDGEDLRAESWYYILPSVAIYQTLRKNVEKDKALKIFREIYFVAAYKGAEYLRKQAQEPSSRKEFVHQMAENKEGERAGFRFHLVQDDAAGAEFHVLRCPYCDFCAQYDCAELIPLFCECDDVVYGSIHPALLWERTRTLGRGDPLCDFKFRLLDEAK